MQIENRRGMMVNWMSSLYPLDDTLSLRMKGLPFYIVHSMPLIPYPQYILTNGPQWRPNLLSNPWGYSRPMPFHSTEFLAYFLNSANASSSPTIPLSIQCYDCPKDYGSYPNYDPYFLRSSVTTGSNDTMTLHPQKKVYAVLTSLGSYFSIQYNHKPHTISTIYSRNITRYQIQPGWRTWFVLCWRLHRN